MGSFYLTCILFIVVVLGLISRYVGFSIFSFMAYIKDELFTVLGTSSSESVLLPLMDKLERLGCLRSVVGLVVPSGYSFNLAGTNYLSESLAALFVAQALNIDLTIAVQQLTLLLIAMLTSKGASGVTGAGFITLAATLAVVPSVPVAGLSLILGIDRFMSEARALTNVIGNGVATIVVAEGENELNPHDLVRELRTGCGAREEPVVVAPTQGSVAAAPSVHKTRIHRLLGLLILVEIRIGFAPGFKRSLMILIARRSLFSHVAKGLVVFSQHAFFQNWAGQTSQRQMQVCNLLMAIIGSLVPSRLAGRGEFNAG